MTEQAQVKTEPNAAASSSTPAKPSNARPGWDKDVWEAKAKEKDAKYAEQAKERDAALAQGKKPRYQIPDDLPKPTKALEMRTDELDINKNVNKTMIVQTSTSGTGPRGAGFYCDLCDRTLKDSLSYLDHINGRMHLRRLGQTTQVTRSTLSQVRAKIASLRAATASKVTAQNFDFNARIAAIKAKEAEEKQARKEDRKRKRQERRDEEEGRGSGKGGAAGAAAVAAGVAAGGGSGGGVGVGVGVGGEEDEARRMEEMMGFGGFSGKKRK